MAASITLHQIRTNDPEGTYTVENTLSNAVGIPTELFVLDNVTGNFNHVANVFELTSLPVTETVGFSFYRSLTTTKSFTNVDTAIGFAEDLKRRVDLLVAEYTEEVDAFPGEEDTNFPLPVA